MVQVYKVYEGQTLVGSYQGLQALASVPPTVDDLKECKSIAMVFIDGSIDIWMLTTNGLWNLGVYYNEQHPESKRTVVILNPKAIGDTNGNVEHLHR